MSARTRLVAVARDIRGSIGGGTPPEPAARPPSTGGGLREPLRVMPRASHFAEYRINLLVASAAPGSAYGGVQTAIDLFRALAGSGDRRRIISLDPLDRVAIEAFPDFRPVVAGDDPADASQLVSIAPPDAETLPVGPRDVFVTTFWPTAAFALDVRGWQASTFGRVPDWFVYLIQDYEPAFYPRSAQQLLARATYGSGPSTIAIFNTTLLQDEFHATGIRFATEFSFEPRLPAVLRDLPARPAGGRSRTILVYGRPSKPRNAFPLIVDGLRAWRASYPDADRWSVVSAGETHVDIDLGGGVVMRSLGKLDLASYADLLREASIGVALMVSPHPSYPPLEMAQLGLLVLTNRFGEKDLSTWHSNISSLRAFTVDSLGKDLTELCRRLERDPTIGDRGLLLHPDYLDDGPQFPFADAVAAMLRDA